MNKVYVVVVNGQLDRIYAKREDAIRRLNELLDEFKEESKYSSNIVVERYEWDDYVFAHDIINEDWYTRISVQEKTVR